jgi:glycerol-3-phosphate cytidylyltransferase
MPDISKKYHTGIICGSFDLIHPGYIRMFKEAKDVCDHLIVALQNDPTIDRPDKCKPVQKFSDRKEVLSSIKFVDSILGYNTEKELSELLTKAHHDVRILGSDYIDRKVFTGSELNKPIYYCNRGHEYSTTALKEAIYKERLNFKSRIK